MLNNCLINFGASNTIIPKYIAYVMHLKDIITSNGVLRLDGTNVKTIGVVKDVGIKLHKCSKIFLIQDIIMVDFPPLFGLYLSRELIAKLGGYLAMDYSHIMVLCKVKRIKIFKESISPFHVKKMHQIHMTYYGAEELDGLIKDLHLKDENTMNFLNYVEEVGSRNYIIIKSNTLIPALTRHQLKGLDIWDMHFDKAKSKLGYED